MIVVLVRHAEPAGGSSNPGLSPPGTARAAALAKMLRDAGIQSIFTSDLRRTKDTAAAIATTLGITPVELASDPGLDAQLVRAAVGPALVVGHTDTVPELIEALGGPPAAANSIGHGEFDRMFVLNVSAQGAASRLLLRYGP